MKLTKVVSLLAVTAGALALVAVPSNAQAKTKKKAAVKPVTIYLTRHGETTGNVMGWVQGWSDF
ncbi:hypothetical protein PJI20_29575, partial [Mycobacterium kansasii]